ncbi:MAG: hypothetical protein AB8B62_08590 [Roseobacter sp.]
MAENTEEFEPAPNRPRPTSLGIYDRPKFDMVTNVEIIALGLSLVWLIGAAIFFLALPESTPEDSDSAGALHVAMVLIAIFMPIGMIWVAALAARAANVMREESQRLQGSLDAIRQTYIVQNQSAASGAEPSSLARKLDEIGTVTRKTEHLLAALSSRPEPSPSGPAEPAYQAPAADVQPALALGTPHEELAPPLGIDDFIRALNFPETAEDTAGFAALRRALKDRPSAQLVQAAQDVLTLLSQEGIYMDDLTPDRARPEVWRDFGQGLRGQPIAALGGIRDRSSLALTVGRMKQDPIFRDAAHHFLRLFDKTFAEFANRASDADIAALADTRTARAFMLLGRVAGTFD